MAPTDWADDKYEQVRWNRQSDNAWNNNSTANNYGAGVKVVTIEDPELLKSKERLVIRNAKLEKEVKELRKFKNKATVLEKFLNEIKKNMPSIKIARLVRRIGVVR